MGLLRDIEPIRAILTKPHGLLEGPSFGRWRGGCAALQADGLAVDADGGVWVALGGGGAVARFLPDGTCDELIDLPAQFVSSLSFGGVDMCDVLISTADNTLEPEPRGTLFRARSAVAGLAVAPVRA